MKILSVLLEITPDLATRASETPLSSPMGTMWCLYDPTPSGWCKMDALSMDFASNWLERLPAGSISTWEDLTTRFLAQFFPPGRTAKLLNDILMFQQHQEEARHPIIKNINAISLVKIEKEKNTENNEVVDKNVVGLSKLNAIKPNSVVDIKKEVVDGTNDEQVKNVKEEPEEELVEMPRSQPVGYYLKHEINEKLIEGLVGNQRYNDSLLATRSGGLKWTEALVDQGSDVNVMPMSTYNRLTSKKPIVTDIRLSLANIKEDKKKAFILGTPILTTAKAEIKFDKGIITLKSGKNKVNCHKIPEFLCKIEEETKDGIDPVTPTSTVNKLILEWEERINSTKREIEFNQWRSKVFNDERS
ncbi:zinc finger, CCHC-type containing protein [Tanacetum coccineum]|uniref:Zinc finger, CCHC-type containing protein n=1 Tax=Tanacetum coccineum TaxID=301880 RepID=A0ABQ5I5K4_9ASTR